MARKTRGLAMATKVPSLSLEGLHPDPGKHINLNCCGDVDCGNYGVGASFPFHHLREKMPH